MWVLSTMVLFTTTSTYIQLQRQYDSYSYFNSYKILKNSQTCYLFLKMVILRIVIRSNTWDLNMVVPFLKISTLTNQIYLKKLDSFTMKKCGCDFCQHVTNSQQLQRQYDFYSYSYSYSNKILKNSPNFLSFLEVDNSFFP